jgi:hypothetical protein
MVPGLSLDGSIDWPASELLPAGRREVCFRQAEFSEAGLGSAGEYTAQNNKPVAGET